MKKLNYLFFIIWLSLIPWSSALGVVGFGVQGGQSILTVASSISSKDGADLTTTEFANPFSGGGYLYIDAIPVIDLEADFSVSFKKYTFDFENEEGVSGPYDFGWADFSIYLSAGKKIVGIGIPLLAKAKLFYGGGYNMHTVTPLMSMDLMESALGGDLTADPINLSEDDLIDFLKENQVKTSGFHIQSGLQFKVLMLDTFLFYRHTFAKDVIPGQDHFGSLNLRMGMGF
ncbi:MAG TPA: hypothetical protein EYO48_07040 [Candidatus Marinimicrobia bacterium]|nr:hypothetical protein [Candidatus Neomarinimicrobiota bacterium]